MPPFVVTLEIWIPSTYPGSGPGVTVILYEMPPLMGFPLSSPMGFKTHESFDTPRTYPRNCAVCLPADEGHFLCAKSRNRLELNSGSAALRNSPHMPITPALSKLRQGHSGELEATVGYINNSQVNKAEVSQLTVQMGRLLLIISAHRNWKSSL